MHLRGHGQVCEGWVQVKGQRLSAMAVWRYQLLMGHRLELREMAHWGMVEVGWQDALRVEGPPVIWTVTEGVNALVTAAVRNHAVGGFSPS